MYPCGAEGLEKLSTLPTIIRYCPKYTRRQSLL